MNDKEFEEFFKSLDNSENSDSEKKNSADDEFVFSNFFEDNTTRNKDSEQSRPSLSFSEDDDFAPPPPSADDDDEPFAPPPSADEEEKEHPQPQAKEPAAEKLFGGLFAKKEEKQKKEKLTPEPEEPDEPEESDEQEYDPKAKEKRKRKVLMNWLTTIIWVSCVLAVSVFIAYFALSSINDLVGFSKQSHEAEVIIPEGATLGEIANILKDNGIIDEPFTFEVYARVKKMQNRLYAGTYTLNSNLGYDQIFLQLRSKELERKTVTLTFYEGMTASQIAKKLEENGVCGYDEFMEVVDTASFDYEFESMMGTSEYIYHKWEGYLFPDTYEIYPDATRENIVSVVEKMLKNFEVKTAELRQEAAKQEKDWRELVILASIVEKEGQKAEELPVISAVFQNRLADGMKLESCATVQYVLPEHKEVLSYEDIAVESPYNTYLYEGLTPGPIGNPGLLALKAALQPADSEYYFFVARADGSHYFARTYAEHEANIQKSNSEG